MGPLAQKLRNTKVDIAVSLLRGERGGPKLKYAAAITWNSRRAR
jgi:hypothetical protein